MNEQINKQLGELEEELNRLKQVTDYIDGTKDSANKVITKLEDVQKSYVEYSNELSDLYISEIEKLDESFNSHVDELTESTTSQIKEGVANFETTGNSISGANQEQIVEIKSLIEETKKASGKMSDILQVMEDIDFQKRIELIEARTNRNGEQNHSMKLILLGLVGLVAIDSIVISLILWKVL